MICDECETVAHCLKNGCVPKHQALDRMAENARELGLMPLRGGDYESALSQYGSPELQAMIVARALEKDCAAQPALKPLTDEEIMKVWQPVARRIFGIVAEGHSMDVYGIKNASMILHLSRAIEAAHGIKENT